MTYGKKIDELAFLMDTRDTIINENLSLLSRGTPLFQGAGIIITDDRDQEFISPDRKVVVVETEYAQELSWLISLIRDNMKETISECDKAEFYTGLAYAAIDFMSRSDDRTGLLLAVLLQATMTLAAVKQSRCDRLKDEVLSCAAGLNDLAEKM